MGSAAPCHGMVGTRKTEDKSGIRKMDGTDLREMCIGLNITNELVPPWKQSVND